MRATLSFVANLLVRVAGLVYKLKQPVCLFSSIFQQFFHSFSLHQCAITCSPLLLAGINPTPTSKPQLTMFLKCSHIPTNDVRLAFNVVVKCWETPTAMLYKLTSSLVAITFLFASLSTALFVLFVFLSRAICLPVWPSICVSACLLACLHVCMHIYPSRYSSLWQLNAESFCPPRFGSYPGKTFRWLIWGLVHVKLIAFHHLTFWQWYWWMASWKMWQGIASWHILMPALWESNEFHLSKHGDGF